MIKKKTISIFLCIAMLFSCCLFPSANAVDKSFSVKVESAALLDINTGELIYSKAPHKQSFIGSLTKLMPLIIFFEALEKGELNLNEYVQISAYAVSEIDGSNVGLRVGNKVKVEDLLKAIILASGCDACIALCEHLSGSEAKFVDKMNKKASLMGLKNTHFENCTGVDTKVIEHYSSAYDVALMSKELMKHSDITRYTTIVSDSICNNSIKLKNTNPLLSKYTDCIGLKTGTTSRAGYCLSAIATREKVTLCAVVLGAKSSAERIEQTKSLLNYGLNGKALHSFNDKVIIAPTCLENGLKRRVCTKCKTQYLQSVQSLGHDWQKTDTAALCTEPIYKTVSCLRDSSHTKTITVKPIGHNWGEWELSKNPTCTQEGKMRRVCSRDASHIEIKAVPTLSHTPLPQAKEDELPPTCTENGYYKTVVRCADCKTVISETTVKIDALGHKSKLKFHAPSKTRVGYTKKECSLCGTLLKQFAYMEPTGKISSIRCEERKADSLKISWKGLKGAQAYQIRISKPNGKKPTVTYYSQTASGFVFSSLKPGCNYLFCIRLLYKADNGKYYYGDWSKTVSFSTLPAGTEITKIHYSDNSLTAQWKQTKNISGYQIQYSLNENFSKSKILTMNNPEMLKKTFKGLKSNKLYFFRIRTFKNAKKPFSYSSWSKSKIVKT